jgi:hypothetical protein
VWISVFESLGVKNNPRRAGLIALEPYLCIDGWMGPAIARGVRLATYEAAPVLTVGIAAIALAMRREFAMERRRSLPPAPAGAATPLE